MAERHHVCWYPDIRRARMMRDACAAKLVALGVVPEFTVGLRRVHGGFAVEVHRETVEPLVAEIDKLLTP